MVKNNRRQWPRHHKSRLIQYCSSLREGYLPAQIGNFSRGGLYLLHETPLKKGSTITIRLDFELAGLARDVRATVKWCVPAGRGGYASGVEYEAPLHWTRYD